MNYQESFIYRADAWQIILVLFILMVLLTQTGFYVSSKKFKNKPLEESNVNTTIVGSLFALFGFILAFTFSMSDSRFNARRANIVEESNSIGTAVLRADLYPADQRQSFRSDFKQYIEARIRYFDAGRDKQKLSEAMNATNKYASLLWQRAATLSHDNANELASRLMIPALNSMIDITNTRYMAETARVPDSIIVMLFILSLVSAFFAGYISVPKGIDWLVIIGFSVLTVMVIYITLDLDRPYRGLINLSGTQQTIVQLMKMIQ